MSTKTVTRDLSIPEAILLAAFYVAAYAVAISVAALFVVITTGVLGHALSFWQGIALLILAQTVYGVATFQVAYTDGKR